MFADSHPVPGPSRIDYTDPTISPSFRYPLGSPFSMGSLKAQFYPGVSPGTLMGPLDLPDLKNRRVPSSFESQNGSLIRMLSGETPTANNTMLGNYTCCGLNLADLHALVEHFEEKHVIVMDESPIPQTQLAAVPSTASISVNPESPNVDTMDEMDLDIDVDDSQSSGGSHSGASTPSPPLTPVLPFDTTAVRRASLLPTSSQPSSPRFESAFNRYSGFTEFSAMLPGAIGGDCARPSAFLPGHLRQKSKPNSNCLPPSLLTSPSPSPSVSPPNSPASPSTTLSRPASNLLLAKPFRCPKPGCNKSYKQANGLKYHIQHGSCNFAPRDESIDCLSEKEAEVRLKPYQCQVPPCTRRYKNMNGLRYHYQHSGAHGAIGLALLASGQHEHAENYGSHGNHQLLKNQLLKKARSGTTSGTSSTTVSSRSSPAPTDYTFRTVGTPMET